jgi:hypothetical protein
MQKILALLAVIAFLGLSSCKKESDDPAICNSDWDTETEAEYNALFAAYGVYANDMSVANCIAYKQAYAVYIDALKPYLKCTSWSADELKELQDGIDELEDSMNQLNCE